MIDDSFSSLPPFMRIKLAVDEADLMGLLAIHAPPDEYDIESREIADRIEAVATFNGYIHVVDHVFRSFFGPSFSAPDLRIHALARVIWRRLQPEPFLKAATQLECEIVSLAHRVEGRFLQEIFANSSKRHSALGFDQAGLIDGATIVWDLASHGEIGAAFHHLLYMIETAATPLLDEERQTVERARDAYRDP